MKTSKYTVSNFLCKNLFEQVQRFLNVWFIFLSGLMLLGQKRVMRNGQKIPVFPAVVPPAGTLMALVPMMALNAVLAAIDDVRRHRADREENEKEVHALAADMSTFEPKMCQELAVGDIILVEGDRDLPADVVALISTGDQGACYVSTANLDGETNLKVKSAAQCTQQLLPEGSNQRSAIEKLSSISGSVNAEAPSQDIHSFGGNITLEGHKVEALSAKNLLLRGTILRNTAWCIGLVVYTGPHTRMVMNSRPAPTKIATLEWALNVITIIMIMFQCFLAVISTIGALTMRPTMAKYFYLTPLEEYLLPDVPAQWLGFFLLYSNLVPVSCFATVEACNFVQAYFINNDKDMLDREAMVAARCRATNLCHELGQVSYIFSDKTGTLTQNVMELKLLCIGGEYFGDLDSSEKGFQGGPKFEHARQGALGNVIEALLEVMAVGHTVIVSPNGTYEAESAEEGTMVDTCAKYGYRLKARAGQTMELLVGPQARPTTYEVLGLNAFNSDRKRMSLVVRKENGECYLLVKGADNVMMERASKPDPKLLEQLNQCSSKGLRCLVIGRRKLSDSEVRTWQQEHQQAEASMVGRERSLGDSAEKIERNLEILGATAIEDKLQEKVGETIQMIRWAGVKLWVLTGDKLETARNIGLSTKVLTNTMTILQLEAGSDLDAIMSQARDADAYDTVVGLMVTGKALSDIKDADRESDFLELSTICRVVIACRVSPSQKAAIVSLVRDGVKPTPVTLCIGDGANDVPMIQEAHVGVGIFGKEGRQAVNNSDFAIGQFRFLQYLLFVHGRWNYLRVAKVILYSFWRNGVLVISMFFYSTSAGWSGTSIYEDLIRGTFNVATALPSLCLGIFDRDMDKTDSLSLYAFNEAADYLTEPIVRGEKRIPRGGILEFRRGMNGEELNVYTSVSTILSAFFHSILLYVNMRVCYPGFDMYLAGDIYTFGTALFTCLILDVMYRGMLVARVWSWPLVSTSTFSLTVFVCFIICYGLVGYIKISNTLAMYMVWRHVFGTGIFWICLLTVPLVAMAVDTCKQYVFDQWLIPYFFRDVDALEHVEAEVLHPGASVVIHGMLDEFEDEHNLQDGECIEKNEDSDTWAVKLDSGTTYLYKSRNLAMRNTDNTKGMKSDFNVVTQTSVGSSFVMDHIEDHPPRHAHTYKDVPQRRAENHFLANREPSDELKNKESYSLIKDNDEVANPIDTRSFAQQEIPSMKNYLWKYPCHCASISLVVSGALFLFIGGCGLVATNRTHEMRILYDGEPQTFLPKWLDFMRNDQGEAFERHPCVADSEIVGKSCDVDLVVQEDMEAPITVYYEIAPFFQNYYDYFASVSWKQLLGQEDRDPRCSKDTAETAAGNPIVPCGLQAQAFFNDTYEVVSISKADGTAVASGPLIDETGIAWESDLKRFGNPKDYPSPETTLWQYERSWNIQEATGLKNPHFAAWMRPDAFQTVRKHYGRVNRDLRKGEIVKVRIHPRYPLPEGAYKEFVFTTLNIFGGRNNAFAWFFLTAGVAAMMMALFVCTIHGAILPWLRRRRFDEDCEPEELSDEDDSNG